MFDFLPHWGSGDGPAVLIGLIAPGRCFYTRIGLPISSESFRLTLWLRSIHYVTGGASLPSLAFVRLKNRINPAPDQQRKSRLDLFVFGVSHSPHLVVDKSGNEGGRRPWLVEKSGRRENSRYEKSSVSAKSERG